MLVFVAKPWSQLGWRDHGQMVRPPPYEEEKLEPRVVGTVSTLIKTLREFGNLHFEKKPSVCWVCSDT